ncbi:MAG: dihydrolipoamide acetyltransferase family protein, partial [Eubacteriales bacterium]
VPNSKIRNTIASRMVKNLATAAHYSIFSDIDMTEAIRLRERLNQNQKDNPYVKVSYNDIIIKCAAKAIEKAPLINSSFCEDHIKVWNNVNFGVAVAVDNGIIVPVVHQCQEISLIEVAKINANNITAVRTGKFDPELTSGGTITISSMGMLGVSRFTSIINQPESAIISVGSIIDKPVVIDKNIVIRPIMTITSTFDHRGIDGAVGAFFAKKLKEYLEEPYLLLK